MTGESRVYSVEQRGSARHARACQASFLRVDDGLSRAIRTTGTKPEPVVGLPHSLRLLNPMPSSTEEPHTHTPRVLVSSSLAGLKPHPTGLLESKASCQPSPAAGQPPILITRDAPPCTYFK